MMAQMMVDPMVDQSVLQKAATLAEMTAHSKVEQWVVQKAVTLGDPKAAKKTVMMEASSRCKNTAE